jgi:integrase
VRGSIEKRGKNSYRISVYQGYDPETGKRNYYRETVKGKKRAEGRLNEVMDQTVKQEFVEPSKMSFYEFLKEIWLPHIEADDTKGTYSNYVGYVENHIKNDPIAKIPLSKLELIHFENFKIKKLKDVRLDGKKDKDGKLLKISSGTVKNILIALKASMVYACQLHLIKYSSAQYLTFPKVPKYKARVWTEEEAQRFLEAASEDRFYFLFLLAIFYSKRKGELRGLKKSDVDLEALTASIRQSVRGSGYSAIFSDTKTDESVQLLELESWMVPFFKKEFADRTEEESTYGAGYSKNDLVFASYNGNPVKERTLDEHYKKIIKIAKVPEMRFHDLRHTCITIMLKRGWSMKHVQTRGGWSDIKTPGNIYSHVTPAMQKDVNEDMAKALNINIQLNQF